MGFRAIPFPTYVGHDVHVHTYAKVGLDATMHIHETPKNRQRNQIGSSAEFTAVVVVVSGSRAREARAW